MTSDDSEKHTGHNARLEQNFYCTKTFMGCAELRHKEAKLFFFIPLHPSNTGAIGTN